MWIEPERGAFINELILPASQTPGIVMFENYAEVKASLQPYINIFGYRPYNIQEMLISEIYIIGEV